MPNPDSAPRLNYARPADPASARVEWNDDGAILVLPAENVSSAWFGVVSGFTITLVCAAWAFAVATKWVHPEWSPTWRARHMFTPGLAILIGSLGAVASLSELRAHRRGQPRQPRRLLRRVKHHAGRHLVTVVRSVEVRRLYFPWTLRPRWGLRVTYGRSAWTWGREYHAVGTDRLHAERLAAELRRLLGLGGGEATE